MDEMWLKSVWLQREMDLVWNIMKWGPQEVIEGWGLLLTRLILSADRDDPSSPMSGYINWSDNQLDIFLGYNWK